MNVQIRSRKTTPAESWRAWGPVRVSMALCRDVVLKLQDRRPDPSPPRVPAAETARGHGDRGRVARHGWIVPLRGQVQPERVDVAERAIIAGVAGHRMPAF